MFASYLAMQIAMYSNVLSESIIHVCATTSDLNQCTLLNDSGDQFNQLIVCQLQLVIWLIGYVHSYSYTCLCKYIYAYSQLATYNSVSSGVQLSLSVKHDVVWTIMYALIIIILIHSLYVTIQLDDVKYSKREYIQGFKIKICYPSLF